MTGQTPGHGILKPPAINLAQTGSNTALSVRICHVTGRRSTIQADGTKAASV
ncbi:hypothetical protein D1BOALGB6SA_10683 [Olavius sp. associated proteobacterium Delta 1]|nr:hypothetical protein D1BOALGB6SA_10683 [Olavius sp. associated proteobacterium Delta 1]